MLGAYALSQDAFTSSVAERESLPLTWWEARLSDDALADEIVLGAFVDGRLVGVTGLSFETREKLRHKAILFGMYVDSGFRQQGIGRRLVDAALACARSRPDIKVVKLTVTQGNQAAQALYERCGFETFGLEPYAIALGSSYVAKVHMWCEVVASRQYSGEVFTR